MNMHTTIPPALPRSARLDAIDDQMRALGASPEMMETMGLAFFETANRLRAGPAYVTTDHGPEFLERAVRCGLGGRSDA